MQGGKPGLLPVRDKKVSPEELARNIDSKTKLQREMGDQKDKHDKDKKAIENPETEIIEEEEEEEPIPEIVQYPIAPKYKLLHSYPVDYGEFWNESDCHKLKKFKRPKELVLTVELPQVETAKDLNCDVKEKKIVQEYLDKYYMTLNLPFEVDELNGKAKFDGKKKYLRLTLPVVQKSQAEEMEDELQFDNERDESVMENVVEDWDDVDKNVVKRKKQKATDTDKVQGEDEFEVQEIADSEEKVELEHKQINLEDLEGVEGVKENFVADEDLVVAGGTEKSEQTEVDNELLEVNPNSNVNLNIVKDCTSPIENIEEENRDDAKIEQLETILVRPEITNPSDSTDSKVVVVAQADKICEEKSNLGFIKYDRQILGNKIIYQIKKDEYVKESVITYKNNQNFLLKNSFKGQTFYFWIKVNDAQLVPDLNEKFDIQLNLIRGYIGITITILDNSIKDEVDKDNLVRSLENVMDNSCIEQFDNLAKQICQESNYQPPAPIEEKKEQEIKQQQDSDDEDDDEPKVFEEKGPVEIESKPRELEGQGMGDDVIDSEEKDDEAVEPAEVVDDYTKREKFQPNFMGFKLLGPALELD